ncbi:MAG: hypothetical protein ACXVAY_21435 [Mucilaginibacter sp.]
MIHAGVAKIALKKSWITNPCPVCKTPNSLHITVFQQYITFLVPVFPLGKMCYADCSSCKANLEIKYMSPEFYAFDQQWKADTKTPMWLFTGTILLTIGAIVLAYYAKENDKRVNGITRSAQKNDLFEIRIASGNYTLYKVDYVKDDTVYFLPNKSKVSEGSPIDDLYKKYGKDFESKKTIALTKLQLLQMNSRGEVFDAMRNATH